MNVFLLHPNQDFRESKLRMNERALTKDLELETLFAAISKGDAYLLDTARKVMLSEPIDPGTIRYRQDILKDCIGNPLAVREIYRTVIETFERRRHYYYGVFAQSPSSILYGAVEIMLMLMKMLGRLRALADEHAGRFLSEGFAAFFVMLKTELNDAYFAEIRNHLRKLRFRQGVLVSAELKSGNRGGQLQTESGLCRELDRPDAPRPRTGLFL